MKVKEWKDGYSYPNKFAFGFFEQLNIPFRSEYSAPWTNKRRYDFYFKLHEKEYVVEMDGEFHFKDNLMSGMTREEASSIDKEKDKLAEENHVHMIRINSRRSTIKHIKKHILLSDLNTLFDLSNIDWVKCGESAANSILIKICDLWNKQYSVSQICEISKCKRTTVWRYITRGSELNMCDYRPAINRPVICLNTKEIFSNGREAADKCDIPFVGNLSANCKGRSKSSGKDSATGEKLKWMFYDEYLEKQLEA